MKYDINQDETSPGLFDGEVPQVVPGYFVDFESGVLCCGSVIEIHQFACDIVRKEANSK